MTSEDAQEKFSRPGWMEAGMWMGAEFPGLFRLLSANRFQVRPQYLPDCLIDLSFSMANSILGGLQTALYRGKVKRVRFHSPPLFVLGHWRTGTTLLHELLAADSRHAAPTTFQCFLPHHFLISERLLKSWSGFLLPTHRPPDRVQMGWDRPQEDEFALCNRGAPSLYSTIAFPNHPPQQMESLTLDGLDEAGRQRWLQAWLGFLKAVQLRNPERRLIIKSPTHTFRIPTIHEQFPDARYVLIVRNPYDVFPSTVRLWKSLYSVHGYQQPNFEGLEEFVFRTFLEMHDRFQETRGLLDENRLLVVRYEQLAADPVSVLRNVYERLELGDFGQVEQQFQEYAEQHADYRTNQYELSDALRDEIYQRWRRYFEAFDYQQDG